MIDLPALYEFHGPVMPTLVEATTAWAEMCTKYGILAGGRLVFTEYPEGASVGHRMEAE